MQELCGEVPQGATAPCPSAVALSCSALDARSTMHGGKIAAHSEYPASEAAGVARPSFEEAAARVEVCPAPPCVPGVWVSMLGAVYLKLLASSFLCGFLPDNGDLCPTLAVAGSLTTKGFDQKHATVGP